MKTFTDTVRSAVDGQLVQADIAVCEVCECTFFGAFQIAGQDHFHLQCLRCQTSYCPQGRCEDLAVAGGDGLVTEADPPPHLPPASVKRLMHLLHPASPHVC